MKSNTKSSITLPPAELSLVIALQKRLGFATKVEVVRAGLHLLKERNDRRALREQFHEASSKIKGQANEFDDLSSDGLPD
jgi:Arc/MetJ-type ribon-helix-helix transcriptional regulator